MYLCNRGRHERGGATRVLSEKTVTTANLIVLRQVGNAVHPWPQLFFRGAILRDMPESSWRTAVQSGRGWWRISRPLANLRRLMSQKKAFRFTSRDNSRDEATQDYTRPRQPSVLDRQRAEGPATVSRQDYSNRWELPARSGTLLLSYSRTKARRSPLSFLESARACPLKTEEAQRRSGSLPDQQFRLGNLRLRICLVCLDH